MKIAYYIITGLLTAIMGMSIGMYFFNHAEVVKNFASLGYPAYIIYPLAVAKILGLLAIWAGTSKTLKEWAYAGFFFNIALAVMAHLVSSDSKAAFAIIALVLVLGSYYSGKKLGLV